MNNVDRMIAGLRCCAENKNVCVADECPLFEMCQANKVNPLGVAAEMLAALVQQRNEAESDRDALEAKLSELLSHVTGGRFSKSTYSIADMKRVADDYQQSECEKCDELAQVKRERDAAVRDVAYSSECGTCGHFGLQGDNCQKCRNHTAHPYWKWRGVQEVAEDDEP